MRQSRVAAMMNGRRAYFFFAVLADCLNCLAVGAPAEPGFLIFSPLPDAIRIRLA